jgi:hypothetical protein
MTTSTQAPLDLLILILVRCMRPHQVNRTEALVLIVVAVGCFVEAWFSYSGHLVTHSNLYAPDIPGWVHLFLFVFIGVIVRLTYISSRAVESRKTMGVTQHERSNQTLELTASRRTTLLFMISTVLPVAERAPARSTSTPSR